MTYQPDPRRQHPQADGVGPLAGGPTGLQLYVRVGLDPIRAVRDVFSGSHIDLTRNPMVGAVLGLPAPVMPDAVATALPVLDSVQAALSVLDSV